ncbi:DNA-J related domain-containing protein [Aurantivibrio plasticivorans]
METAALRRDLSELFLNAEASSYSEYELLSLLSGHDVLSFSDDNPELQLFRRHFVLMNTLYDLQQQWLEDNVGYLTISPLAIALKPLGQAETCNLPSANMDADRLLREYYGDWRHFEDMKPGNVRELLQGFWEMYASYDGRADFLNVLGVSNDASMDEIKRRYQELVATHHPDKGGDVERFREVREAYEALSKFKE